MKSIHALVPIKRLASAKERLAAVLPEPDRQALVLLCLDRVLVALHEATSVGDVILLGQDEPVKRLAYRAGALWLPDPGRDLNEGLRHGFSETFRLGAEACLFVPADLPLLAPGEIDAFVGASREATHLTLAPAPDGGTNAILLPGGRPFQPQMGTGSFARHVEAARARGIPLACHESPGLSFDLDTPQDLRQLWEQRPSFARELGNWRTFLEFCPSAPCTDQAVK